MNLKLSDEEIERIDYLLNTNKYSYAKNKKLTQREIDRLAIDLMLDAEIFSHKGIYLIKYLENLN